MFPNAESIQQTLGLQSAQSVALTQGLQPNFNQNPNDQNVTYIQPALLPPISNAQGGLQVVLSNQLAGQMAKLFQDLFPITQDPDLEATFISDTATLQNNRTVLMNDISQIKMTVLTINQLVILPTSRIPNGYTYNVPNPDAVTTAGLSTPANPNVVLQAINQVWRDLYNEDYVSAQLDYGTLRNLLQPYWGL